jgi:hypothetical protein
MSRDIVFIVVPFAQVLHESDSFKDFWRFTPSGMRRLFEENRMSLVYEASSPNKNAGVYLLFIGSKKPDKWKATLPNYEQVREAGEWIGYSIPAKICRAVKRVLGYAR